MLGTELKKYTMFNELVIMFSKASIFTVKITGKLIFNAGEKHATNSYFLKVHIVF